MLTVTGGYDAELELVLNQSKIYIELKAEGSGFLDITGRTIHSLTGVSIAKPVLLPLSFLFIIAIMAGLYGSWYLVKRGGS